MGQVIDLKPKGFAPSDFEAGNTHEPVGEERAYTAGINVQSWMHRVECYGKTEQDACDLRDHVLKSLTKGADGPSGQTLEGSHLYQLVKTLGVLGIEFKRDRSDILKSDSIMFDPVDGGAKVKGHAHTYIAFRFDLDGNFKHVYIGE